MAIPYFNRISSANISARWITGIWRSAAAITSELFFEIAELVTTTSAPVMFSARCPSKVMAPRFERRSVTLERFRSDPDTLNPRVSSTSAMPLIPIPPMPTKWILWIFANMEKINLSQGQGSTEQGFDRKGYEDTRRHSARRLAFAKCHWSTMSAAAISAISAAACGCDKVRAFCAICCNFAGSEKPLEILSTNRSTESSTSGIK